MSQWQGIGVMSGTSLDGVDLAFCTFSIDSEGRWTGNIDVAETMGMPDNWRQRLRALPQGSAEQYASLHVELGHFLGSEIADFIRRHNLQPQFVASHGQTIFHQPGHGFTAQIGDGETIAAHLEVPVVTNFRAKDVALGGQGAPLVPFGEVHLFARYTFCLNLGGFANLSCGDIAYDVSPCNLPLNLVATQAGLKNGFDNGGEMARSGKLLPELFNALESLPYYTQPAPKSLGTEWLEASFLPILQQFDAAPADLLHTLVEHISQRIAEAIASHGQAGTLLVTGGGARNRYLLERISAKIQPLDVRIESVSNLMVDFKEAYLFAFLGLMTLLGQTNTLSSVTGASRAVCGGSVHLPPGGGWRLI